MSGWDVSNVTTMFHTFADCFKMETYVFSGWDTSRLEIMDGIFNSNRGLTTIYVGDNWNLDPAKVSNSTAMFSANGKLVGGNGTTYNSSILDATYARVDMPAVLDADGNVITEAVPGYLTHISDKPAQP